MINYFDDEVKFRNARMRTSIVVNDGLTTKSLSK
jgi:hypothetical protein